MSTPNQPERVARALRFAGTRGISQSDFDPPALDGFPPIRRLASRIADLRAEGWLIDSAKRRRGLAVYRLISCPDQPAPDRQQPDVVTELPIDGAPAPLNAILGIDT